jgi:caa(3)-type oxidase subunit IV
MTVKALRPNYFVIWLWLVGLVLVSIVTGLFLPKGAALLSIFLVALIKAVLVLLNYMHLKFEAPLFYAMVIVPLVIVAILILALFPDFATHGQALHLGH